MSNRSKGNGEESYRKLSELSAIENKLGNMNCPDANWGDGRMKIRQYSVGAKVLAIKHRPG